MPLVLGLLKSGSVSRVVDRFDTSGTACNNGEISLSYVQERLWILEHLGRYAPPNYSRGFLIKGDFQREALIFALREIVQRHKVLRTNICAVEGKLTAHVREEFEIQVPRINLAMYRKDESWRELTAIMDEESQRSFDLSTDIMLRSLVVALSAREHVLLATFHRSVFDYQTSRLFLQDFASLYDARIRRQHSRITTPQLQYSDYALWQRNRIESGALNEQVNFWKDKLAGPLPTLDLPVDRNRPAVQTFKGLTSTFDPGALLTDEIRTFCSDRKVSVSCFLLSVFYLLLNRYTGQDDLIVGIPSSERTSEGTSDIFGCLMSFLAVRLNFVPGLTFLSLLDKVQSEIDAAFLHSEVPFARVLEVTEPERDLSRSPIFQATFSVEPPELETLGLGHCSIGPIGVDAQASEFDISLKVTEDPQISLSWEFNTDLFNPETVTRMNDHFLALTSQSIGSPDVEISELRLLTDVEFDQIVVNWNDTSSVLRKATLHSLFESQVRANPEAFAVVFGEERVTYSELNQRSNMLAHRLRSLGAGPGRLVAICTQRSIGMITGLLGILKSGAGYVPLDPAYPKERTRYILEDAEACLLLTEQALAETVPHVGASLVLIDESDTSVTSFAQHDPMTDVTERDVAYVIYTSGSTGKPKGVVIEHRSAVAFVDWSLGWFDREQLNGVMASTSVCFDLSIFEVFVTLAAGGKIILAENALHLPNLLAANEITLINTTPSAMAEMVKGTIPSSVKLINLCGEPLSTSLVRQIYSATSVEKVFDLYGPSEDTTYSTVALRTPEGPATIGRPITNTQVYILDRHLKPVPVGVPGEIYIGGAGLAREYWKQEKLTLEKFIPNPFDRGGSPRLYKTGDRAKFMADGNIQFLGRNDHQVKIRGYRIEIGEVETVLRSHPAIFEGVVVVREDNRGDKQLVAYVVLNDTAVLAREIKSYLRGILPEYMVPTSIVILESFPETPNGKLDRKRLSTQERENVDSLNVGPRNLIEAKLLELCKEVLKLDQLGVWDNFFEMGGNSILAVRLFVLIEKAFGKKLPLAALFEAKTIEQLSILVSQSETPEAWSSIVPIRTEGTRLPIFLVHGIGGNILSFRSLAQYLDPAQPVYCIQSKGLDGKQSPLTNVAKMAAHYLNELRQVQPEGPYLLGGFSFGGIVAFELARQLIAAGQEVLLLAMFDTSARINKEGYSTAERVRLHFENLRALSIKGKLEYLRRRAITARRKINSVKWRIINGHSATRSSLDASLRNVNEANYLALHRYKIEPHPVRVTLFKAKTMTLLERQDEKLGWDRYALKGVDICEVPGDHVTIMSEPNVGDLARALDDVIKRKLQPAK
jgi:amino acid adenylation domain-containing protein